MAAIINSVCKTSCSAEEKRKTESYLNYYESLELRKEVETQKSMYFFVNEVRGQVVKSLKKGYV